MTKDEIRFLSRETGLPTWNKPAQACLSSRFPYGTAIDKTHLEKIEKAERIFHKLGINQIRVRHHGNVARIEVRPADFTALLSEPARSRLVQKIKRIGYHYVSLDLEGYRTGSMNEVFTDYENSVKRSLLK